jgi:hypothetical protein
MSPMSGNANMIPSRTAYFLMVLGREAFTGIKPP